MFHIIWIVFKIAMCLSVYVGIGVGIASVIDDSRTHRMNGDEAALISSLYPFVAIVLCVAFMVEYIITGVLKAGSFTARLGRKLRNWKLRRKERVHLGRES